MIKLPQPPKERDSLSQDLQYQLLCFVRYTSKVVPSGAKQKLLTCASDGPFFVTATSPSEGVPWQTVVLDAWLVPSAARAACSGDVFGTVLPP